MPAERPQLWRRPAFAGVLFALLWLVAMLPTLDAMAGRRCSGLALVLLLVSCSHVIPLGTLDASLIMNFLQSAGWL